MPDGAAEKDGRLALLEIMIRPKAPIQDERRIREFLAWEHGLSESAASLSHKLQVNRGVCRRVLEGAVSEGLVERRDFDDMDPLYYRFPDRER